MWGWVVGRMGSRGWVIPSVGAILTIGPGGASHTHKHAWRVWGMSHYHCLYRKHKLVCGCYKLADKVNYNLVATLSQGCENLVTKL